MDARTARRGGEQANPRKCEGCGLKVPNFGLPAEGKRRSCAGCTESQDGAVNIGDNKISARIAAW